MTQAKLQSICHKTPASLSLHIWWTLMSYYANKSYIIHLPPRVIYWRKSVEGADEKQTDGCNNGLHCQTLPLQMGGCMCCGGRAERKLVPSCKTVKYYRSNEKCIKRTNYFRYLHKTKPICSTSSRPSGQLDSISLEPLLAALRFLAVLYII